MKRSVLTATALLTLVAVIPAPVHPSGDWVSRTLNQLTLREKVGQMVMAWLPGGAPRPGGAEWRRARRLVLRDEVGGLIVGKGAAFATGAWLNELQRLAPVPLLVAADLEWGAGTRLEGATVLPVNMAIAAAGDGAYAYRAGRITAHEARAAGIHLALAPVADVNVNPANPVINTRSYGADPQSVAEQVTAFIAGARTGGLLTAAKHFPGHGDTEHDSHLELPLVNASRERLDEVELVPFRAAIKAGVPAVMSAHLAVPALEPGPGHRPATVSRSILTEVLRQELGFEGLVITDALIMDGVLDGRSPGTVAVNAVRAGADVLLMPPEADDAIDAVVAAVRSGRLDRERIDASVRRILAAKVEVGLHEDRTVDLRRLLQVLRADTHERWAQHVANRSLTLVHHASGSLPLDFARGMVPRVVSIAYADGRYRPINEVFDRTIESLGGLVDAKRLSRRSDRNDLWRVERAAQQADIVIFASYAHARPWKGHLGLPSEVAALARRLVSDGAVFVGFGDPYVVNQLPQSGTQLLAWSDADVTQRAAAWALAGRTPIDGRLPIPLPPFYARGDGIRLPALAGADQDPDAPLAEEPVEEAGVDPH